MNRRGLTLLEMILAIGITATIGAAIASMMAAVSNGLTSRDDGRRTAVQLATTQVRLAAYIAPSRCVLDKSDSAITIWFDDNRESNTVHASEIRWLEFDDFNNTFVVKFVDFPEAWSQSMIDAADIECNELTNYVSLLATLESSPSSIAVKHTTTSSIRVFLGSISSADFISFFVGVYSILSQCNCKIRIISHRLNY